MMSRLPVLVAFALLVGLFAQDLQAEEYRIDSQERFDRLKSSSFMPGDTILFKRGERFTGMFSPQGQGAAGQPIIIDVYGDGDLPILDAQGAHRAGLLLSDPSFWEVNRLEVTNTDGSDDDQGELFGIYVLADGAEGLFEHVYINACVVRDVNGKVAGKRRGGIHVHIKNLESSRFHDLRITNNRVLRIGGVGIGNDSSCGKVIIREDRSVDAKNLWTKVYVANNIVDTTGRNCVIARVSKDAVYEYNTLAHSSQYGRGGHSIFNFNTDGIRVQYNEAYGNVGEHASDRGGFDADYNSANTFIQYNYSHDNAWFCGIMKRPNHNVTIRHNISQNDRQGIYLYGFEGEVDATQIKIYNNTHYISKDHDVVVFPKGRTPINSTFEKNIFYFEGQGAWGEKPEGPGTRFNDNVYFQITPHPTDGQAHTQDPRFREAGAAGARIDLKTMEGLSGYRLQDSSPYRGYGASLPGWQDYRN